MSRAKWITLAFGALAVIGLAMGLRAAGIDLSRITPERVRTFVLSFGAWALAIYLLIYVQPVVPVPASLMMISAGLAFGSIWGSVASLAGATTRACLQFAMARRLGRDAVGRLLKGRIASLDQQIGRNGFRAVLLIRVIPNFPFDIQNYGLGFSRVRFLPFALATLLGLIPGTVAFVYLGYSLTDPRQAWKLLLAIAVIVAIVFLPRLWKRRAAPQGGGALPLAALALCGLAWFVPNAGAQPAFDHAVWDQLLQQRVRDGRVDYAGLKADPAALERYLISLQDVEPDRLDSRQERLAFWINAYNACVCKGVVDHYPIHSVKDVAGFFDGIRYRIAGSAMTLNQIEAKGRALGDWRIHFAVSCASASGPPLRVHAALPPQLEQQLADETQQFLRDPDRGLRPDAARGVLWVSKIFKWYAKDFIRQGPLTSESLLLVLHRHLDPALLQQFQQRALALNFLEYDWTLNDQARSGT